MKTDPTFRSQTYHSAAEYKAHGLHQAKICLHEGLIRANLNQEDLLKLNGSDPRKVFLAIFLKRKTTVSNVWLAEHLKMKSPANVSRLLANHNIEKLKKGVPLDLIEYVKIEN